MKIIRSRWTALIALNVVAWGLLGAYEATRAQRKGGQLPFANSNEQRSDILSELREIKELIKQQNELLRAGGGKEVPRETGRR
jgi:hypothetical protein